ncbi:hypothetical protein GCM10023217_28300 [Gordonia alkaliphila]|uniref:Uncharacterized protein n=1 Tax=Gordonia alkaliphila TaxID=1053547 RepID=A0ABP8ZFK4_9ACTN
MSILNRHKGYPHLTGTLTPSAQRRQPTTKATVGTRGGSRGSRLWGGLPRTWGTAAFAPEVDGGRVDGDVALGGQVGHGLGRAHQFER